jgi:hypothetical protein
MLIRIIAVATVAAVFGAGAADAACNFRIRLANAGAHPVTVDVPTVQVRSRGSLGPLGAWGPWREVRRGRWFHTTDRLRIEPGMSESDDFRADLGCGHDRQIRATYVCRSGPNNGSSYISQQALPGASSSAQRLHRRLDVGQSC